MIEENKQYETRKRDNSLVLEHMCVSLDKNKVFRGSDIVTCKNDYIQLSAYVKINHG